MLRSVASLALVLHLLPAHADSFYTLVGFQCDQRAEQLTIYYKGAYNEQGASLVEQKTATEWSPGSLIASMKDDDHIGELTTVQGTCKLRQAVYRVTIGPTPGNYNIQGRCGASISAWVEVHQDNRIVLPRYQLEGDCHDMEAPITTKIIFSPAARKPSLSTVLPLEFYK